MSAPHGRSSRSGEQGLEEKRPDPRPFVLVAIKELGPPHSPWMWRQISTMHDLNLQIMYWMPPEVTEPPAVDVPVHVLDADPTPYDGKGRWAFRAANLRGRNFYAARGRERRQIKNLLQSLKPSSLLCYYGEVALRTVDVAHELGIPTIAYFHGDSALKRNRWYRWSLKRRLRRFAEIIVVNQEERAWMLGTSAIRESTSCRAARPRTCSCLAGEAARRRTVRHGVTVGRREGLHGVDRGVRGGRGQQSRCLSGHLR